MKRNYDAVAGVYDGLARLFFGQSIREAQAYLVQYIPAGSSILLVGGGTGWILEEITAKHAADLHIHYLDISGSMIAKSKKRNVGKNTVLFSQQTALQPFEGRNYDVIFTPFFFDNFKQNSAERLFNLLHQKLAPGGLWLYADFQDKEKNNYLQRTLLFLMYTFFRAACNIEAKQLPDTTSLFSEKQYTLLQQKTFHQHFIVGAVYQKSVD